MNNQPPNQGQQLNTPPQQSNQPQPPQTFLQRWFPTIAGVAIVVLVGGGVLAYQTWWSGPSEPEEEQQEQPTGTTPTEFPGTGERVEDETANWKTYTNEEFGVSFNFPPEFGEVVESEFAPSGKVMKLTNATLGFGAFKSEDETSGGRGGSIYDFGGYSKIGGEYYFRGVDVQNPDSSVGYKINPVEVINIEGAEDILVIDPQSISSGNYLFSTSWGIKGLAAYVNLKDSSYPAVVFVSSDDGLDLIENEPLPLEQFLQIIRTIKVF